MQTFKLRIRDPGDPHKSKSFRVKRRSRNLATDFFLKDFTQLLHYDPGHGVRFQRKVVKFHRVTGVS